MGRFADIFPLTAREKQALRDAEKAEHERSREQVINKKERHSH